MCLFGKLSRIAWGQRMVEKCQTLLPDNASRTPFTRALECAAQPRYGELIPLLRGIRTNPSDELLPFILWEYGLLPILPFLGNDLRRTLDEGIPWQTERGTELGILRALSWINEGEGTPFYEEEERGAHWNEIQLDPGHVPSDKKINDIKALVEMSARAITKLARLYHDYDVRRLKWDESQWGDIYSNYSGVLTDGIYLSFGRKHASANKWRAVDLHATRSKLISFVGKYDDRLLLDWGQYGDLPVINHSAVRGRLSTLIWSELETEQPIHVSRVSRDAHVWSESLYDESWYEPLTCTIAGDADIWGDAAWSENPRHLQCDPIDQFIDNQINITNVNEPDYEATTSAYSSLTVATVNQPLEINTSIAMLSHDHLPASSEMVGQYWTDTTWPESTWEDTNTITGVAHHGNTD